jgi:hypothetical protein
MNQKLEPSVYEVFRSSGVPEFTRIIVDEQKKIFDGFLLSPNEHLILHGPSKTGKSTLWSSELVANQVIKIPATPEMQISDLYVAIVDELDVFFTNQQTQNSELKGRFESEIKAKFPGLFGSSLKAGVEKAASSSATNERLVSPQLSSRNIAKYLSGAGKMVVVENIHYSNDDFKKSLAKELHNFSDYASKWILVGVQHKADAIFLENRDLVGRLKEITTGAFTKSQIIELLNVGGDHLNITFSDVVKNRIASESFGIAALAQDIAQKLCIESGITHRNAKPDFQIDFDDKFSIACNIIAKSSKNLYMKFCNDISQGGRSDGSTQKYNWFLRMIKECDIPSTGLLNTEVYANIRNLGHDSIEQSTITQGLTYLDRLQQRRIINPPVLEYNKESKRLFLLDPYFQFALRWIPELIPEIK